MRGGKPGEVPTECMNAVAQRSRPEAETHAVARGQFLHEPLFERRLRTHEERGQATQPTTFLCPLCILSSSGTGEAHRRQPRPRLLWDSTACNRELFCGCLPHLLGTQAGLLVHLSIVGPPPRGSLLRFFAGSVAVLAVPSAQVRRTRLRNLLATILRPPVSCTIPCWPAPMDPGLNFRTGTPRRHLMSAQPGGCQACDERSARMSCHWRGSFELSNPSESQLFEFSESPRK